jgi:hypothetical protein
MGDWEGARHVHVADMCWKQFGNFGLLYVFIACVETMKLAARRPFFLHNFEHENKL